MADNAASRPVSGRWAPATVLSPLVVILLVGGTLYELMLELTPLLARRFPVPYAVPIFDTPFALVGLGIAYLAFERHRLRNDVQSLALGATLLLTGLLTIAHIFAQPDYPGSAGRDAGIAPYFFTLTYLATFLGVALSTTWWHRPLPLTDRTRVLIGLGLGLLAIVVMLGVVRVQPLLPSFVLPTDQWSDFGLWASGTAVGLVAIWALVGSVYRIRAAELDPFPRLFLVASLVWSIGLLGFLLDPHRYAVSWYVAGFARPIGVGVLFVGLIREQVELYREARARLRDLEALYRAGQALVTSLDATQITETITSRALDVSGAQGVILFRLDPDGQALRPISWAGGVSGSLVQGLVLPAGQGVSGVAVVERRPAWSANLSEDWALPSPNEVRERLRQEGFRAVLATPLAMKTGETFGSLSVLYRAARTFTDADVELMRAFGAQVSVALEHARSFEQLALRANHDARLQEFAQELLEATGREEIYADCVRFASVLLGTSHVALLIADPRAVELRLTAGAGWGPGVVGEVTMVASDESFARHAFVRRAPVEVADMVVERRFTVPTFLREHGIRSGLAVPMGVRQEPMGVLTAYYRAPHRFSEEDYRVMTALAMETALALEKARLYEELQQNLERLQETQAQLMQADKLKALGTLLSGMAHELNNPLSTIQLSLQLMKRAPLPDAVQRRIETMEEECDRAARIIRDLLVFARRKPPERRPTDVAEVIRASLTLQAPQFDLSRVRVATDLQPTPAILADPHQLQQVLLNLFTNATHAMKSHAGGGVLTVRVTRQGNEVVVHVDDDGPGIAEKNLGRIFDPFFTTKVTGEGTGLGLSLSIGIVEAHGGRMHAENLPGRGARFTLRLPIEETTGPVVAAPAPLVERAAGQRATVLVIDDEAHLRRVLGDVLTSFGHRVDEVGDGAEGIRRLATGDYDLIMLDLRLPGVDGRMVWEWITERRPDLAGRVVFMTGDTMSDETQAFLAGTGRIVVSKPLSYDRIRAVIDEVATAIR